MNFAPQGGERLPVKNVPKQFQQEMRGRTPKTRKSKYNARRGAGGVLQEKLGMRTQESRHQGRPGTAAPEMHRRKAKSQRGSATRWHEGKEGKKEREREKERGGNVFHCCPADAHRVSGGNQLFRAVENQSQFLPQPNLPCPETQPTLPSYSRLIALPVNGKQQVTRAAAIRSISLSIHRKFGVQRTARKKKKKRSTFNYVRTSDRHACGLQSWKMSSVTHVTLKFAQA